MTDERELELLRKIEALVLVREQLVLERDQLRGELRSVEALLIAALELIEPEHVAKLGDLKLRGEKP
jgi:hypothetical protein